MADPDEAADRRLDANAAAGPLAELFTMDLMAAVATARGPGTARRWRHTRFMPTRPRWWCAAPTAPVCCCATPPADTGCGLT